MFRDDLIFKAKASNCENVVTICCKSIKISRKSANYHFLANNYLLLFIHVFVVHFSHAHPPSNF